jgi:hypothetical protein
MNPAVWLVIWLGSTAVACLITAWAAYLAGFDHGHDEGADRERGRHRIAAPPELPRAGRLPVADPPWEFFGGYPLDPPVGPAEYELMTQTAAEGHSWCIRCGGIVKLPATICDRCLSEREAESVPDETPSAFTRRMADKVEKMIAGWEAQGNYDRHLIQARH